MILTTKDMSERYKLSKSAVSKYVRNGILPAGFKIGKSRRWRSEDLDAFDEKVATQKGGRR